MSETVEDQPEISAEALAAYIPEAPEDGEK